ncbi:MAG: viroplasmin family protein [Bacteroidales bacterium]|nr:viroplasmin family protein [Bacteroidales bacterium]
MPKNKFYVVWVGEKPGVYAGWGDCKKQVEGFNGAKYKGFPTRELAEAAFRDNHEKYLSHELNAPKQIVCDNPLIGTPVADSICVDAACSGNPGVMEYRGVDTKSGAELFRQGPFPEGTVNIGEFLAVVHALAYLKQRNSDWPVYSDSRTAIAWVRKRTANTKLERTAKSEELFRLLERAENWLCSNTWPNKILKWETEFWGEIPADFGRK